MKKAKKALVFVLSAIMVLSILPVIPLTAFAKTEGILSYEIVEGKAKITACDSSATGDITIPDEFEECPVTSIEDGAFRDCDNLTGITIPESVTYIGKNAFEHCDNLKSIIIPDSVTWIDEAAFWDSFLTNITFGSGLATIGPYAFCHCNWLTNIVLPKNLISIGYRAFCECDRLISIIIQNEVTEIGEDAFDGCNSLTDVFYTGLKEEWSLISIGDGNDSLFDAKLHYNFVPAAVYNITYNLNGGINSTANPVNYTPNIADVILKKPTKTGYTFAGWYSDAGYITKVTNIPKGMVGDKAFYAKWIKNTYDIIYTLNGGVNNTNNPLNYSVTDNITLKNPTKKGYTFKGWFSDSDFKTQVRTITKGSTGEKSFYAKWTKDTYNITYVLNGGTNAANPTTYNVTSAFALKNPAKKCYTFDGWYADAKFTTKITKIAAGTVGNKVFYAKWTAIKYKITYKLAGGKNNAKNPKTYNSTAAVKLKNPTRKGYKFVGWYNGKKKVTSIKKGTTGAITLTAKWKVISYKITYKLDKGKNNSKNPKSYKVTTSTIKLKNPTRKGYTFKGWYNGKKKVTQIKKGSTGSITLTAKWKKK